MTSSAIDAIHGWQRTIGNRAVGCWLRTNASAGEVGQRVPAEARLVVDSPGEPLDPAAVRDATGPQPANLTRLRVHRDAVASRSAHAVGARAYAVGDHIVFGSGQYDPDTRSGRRVIAHEIGHVADHQRMGGPADTLWRLPVDAPITETPGQWHVVEPGESLSLIAAEVYGDMMKWPVIFEANRDLITDPDLIEIGWRLFIPPADTAESLAAGAIEGMDEAVARFGFAGECGLDRNDWQPIDHGNFRLKPGRGASAAVLRIFNEGTSMDCAGALWASLAYSVLKTIGPTRFDNVMGREGDDNQNLVIGQRVAKADEGLLQHLVYVPAATSVADLLPGDAVYFKNTEDIHTKHPESPWQGENTIYRGGGLFTGHGVRTMTETEILEMLAAEYNRPPTDAERAHPDYSWRWRWHTVAPSEIPGIQWDSVMRLDAEAVDLL